MARNYTIKMCKTIKGLFIGKYHLCNSIFIRKEKRYSSYFFVSIFYIIIR
jgi:hypothetical protein